MQKMPKKLNQNGFVSKAELLLAEKVVILQLLRFGAIGLLNTALSFIIYNLVSSALHVSSGIRLGELSIPGFVVATWQSYYWNRNWAFSAAVGKKFWKNISHLVAVGLLGAVTFLGILIAAHTSQPAAFFLVVFFIFLILELVMWYGFGLHTMGAKQPVKHMVTFWLVSAVGALINAGLVSLITYHWTLVQNPDLNKNIALIIATGVSMIWNFVGYKVVVFKE